MLKNAHMNQCVCVCCVQVSSVRVKAFAHQHLHANTDGRSVVHRLCTALEGLPFVLAGPDV